MFHKLDEIDWKKALVVLGGITAFWLAIDSLTPQSYDKWVLGIIAGMSAMFTYFMNASKGTKQ